MPVQIIGFLIEQRPTYSCLENVENTPGLVVDRCSVSCHDYGIAERRDHDGDFGTAAKYYLEKLTLIVAYWGCPRKAVRNYDVMMNVRARMMSWPQRYVSMFVYIFSYTAYDDMKFPQESLGLLILMRR